MDTQGILDTLLKKFDTTLLLSNGTCYASNGGTEEALALSKGKKSNNPASAHPEWKRLMSTSPDSLRFVMKLSSKRIIEMIKPFMGARMNNWNPEDFDGVYFWFSADSLSFDGGMNLPMADCKGLIKGLQGTINRALDLGAI
jgi:hypothetical protein